jgi:hypothetical protein
MIDLVSVLENTAASIDAKIGNPDGYGLFITVKGGKAGKKLLSGGYKPSELAINLITFEKDQNSALSNHSISSQTLANSFNITAVSVPEITELDTGYKAESEWRFICHN